MKENYKYEIIKDLANNRISKVGVRIKLQLSICQINRLLVKCQQKGKESFIPKNSKQTSIHCIDDSIR